MMPKLESSHGSSRLAHGWRLLDRAEVPEEIIRNSAVRSVPRPLAAVSKVAISRTDGHDLAMELLMCMGQALWEAARPDDREAYLKLTILASRVVIERGCFR